MKILHLIGSMNPSSGGPCQGIRNSIPALEKYGVFREVASLDDPTSSFLGKDSFPIHALGPSKTPWGYSKRVLPWLISNLPRFDVVIVNGLWLYHGFAALKALQHLKRQTGIGQRQTSIPRLFVMPNGMLDPYFQKASNRKLKAVRNWIYWKLIENKIIREAEGVLFTCETELMLAKQSFQPYQPKKELNVGYGIMTPADFTNGMKISFLEKCPQVENSSYLLFLSRLHDKKGIDLLISAYKQLVNIGDTVSKKIPKLVIAGPGLETPYGQSMKKMVMGDWKDFILFPGMLTGDAKWGAFYGCEAFVLPSHQENFGIAVVEALACKKPVLVSNQVNISHEIHEGNAGIVEKDTLAGTIKLLATWFSKSDEERRIMNENAGKTYLKHFSIEHTGKQLLKAVAPQTHSEY